MDFPTAVTLLLSPIVEGGYSRNPADPGGETMWGITARVARMNGYSGDMRIMPKSVAVAIYQKIYWDPYHIDQMPDAMRYTFFDAGVNQGPGRAVAWVRQLVNEPGDSTIDAQVLTSMALANEDKLAMLFLAERIREYTSLPTFGAFGRGWANRIAQNLEIIGNPSGES